MFPYDEEDSLVDKCLNNTNNKEIITPKGYSESTTYVTGTSTPSTKSSGKIYNAELNNNKKTQLWTIARSNYSSILMNIVMNYMSPNDVQIIPIMMLAMLFINTFKEIMLINGKFNNLNDSIDGEVDEYDLILMKLVYLLSCLINLIIGIWKLNSMGLIPNKQSDWLPFESKLLSKEKFI